MTDDVHHDGGQLRPAAVAHPHIIEHEDGPVSAIVIRGVPALVCELCEEVFYESPVTDGVVRLLEDRGRPRAGDCGGLRICGGRLTLSLTSSARGGRVDRMHRSCWRRYGADPPGHDRSHGRSRVDVEAILEDYPQLGVEDVREALRFAAANLDQRVVPLDPSV